MTALKNLANFVSLLIKLFVSCIDLILPIISKLHMHVVAILSQLLCLLYPGIVTASYHLLSVHLSVTLGAH